MQIATGSFDSTVILWDSETGQRVMDFRNPTPVKSLTFHPSGDSLAAGNNLGAIIIWNIESGHKRRTLATGHNHQVLALDFSPKGDQLVSAGSDATIRIWNVEFGQLSRSIPSRQPLQDVRFSHDGSRLFSATSHGGTYLGFATVDVWELETGRELLSLRGHATSVFSMALDPTGRSITSFSLDGVFRQWECFPWRESEYPGDESRPLRERIRQFASDYRRARYSSTTGGVPAEARMVETQFDDVFPKRDRLLPARLVDLAPWFNGSLDAMWLGVPRTRVFGDDLAFLPQGRQWMANISFDVRGVIQLANNDRFFQGYFPSAANGIRVNQMARHFHFLHASDGWEDDGTQIGSYVVHYADETTDELKIIYGRDLRNWWFGERRFKPFRKEPLGATDALIAWQGTNFEVQAHSPNNQLRLFRKTYANPKPEIGITHIDIVSTMTRAAPFLIAMTVTEESVPHILSQPKSAKIMLGEEVSFHVEAAGEPPIYYQWYRNRSPILNATNATLALPLTTRAHLGSYQVSVNHDGLNSLLRQVSDPAYLGVFDATRTYGRVKADSFLNIPGESLMALTNHVRFPDRPDDVDFLSDLEYLEDGEIFQDNFGARLSGYITPPISGEYLSVPNAWIAPVANP